jgi:malate dehydrogenase
VWALWPLVQGCLCCCAGVVATTDLDVATKDVEFAIMVGGFPRKAGMERKDVMSKNVSIYKSQAASLEKNARPGVKVTVCLSSTSRLTGKQLGARNAS